MTPRGYIRLLEGAAVRNLGHYSTEPFPSTPMRAVGEDTVGVPPPGRVVGEDTIHAPPLAGGRVAGEDTVDVPPPAGVVGEDTVGSGPIDAMMVRAAMHPEAVAEFRDTQTEPLWIRRPVGTRRDALAAGRPPLKPEVVGEMSERRRFAALQRAARKANPALSLHATLRQAWVDAEVGLLQ